MNGQGQYPFSLISRKVFKTSGGFAAFVRRTGKTRYVFCGIQFATVLIDSLPPIRSRASDTSGTIVVTKLC